MLAKYRISRTQIRKDIALAKELFKTQHQFDWDFWHAWMIKDQIQLIRDCKLKGDLKQWNNAKKVLHQMIGEKPASVEDPRRMEKNVFYIQINSMGQKVDIPLNAIRNLSQEEQKVLVDSMYDSSLTWLTISTLIWYRSARHRLSVPYLPGSGRKRCRSCWLIPDRTCLA